ncbi:MAG TPA: response regulator transcription factor [Candidatus Saccharibacteria bacterium]|nr:response regulator transcription factor [Candidatus Saccharibacteria bacterium]HRK94224.1 response regulator transcription factor [Candidatus Saccharibacteria bacterium]
MRVLVIEDEHKIARALKKALEQEHYAVDVSYDGDDGFGMATTEPYDVMVIDRMLPGSYDGLAIIRALREKSIHTPVLLLTALGKVEDKTEGLDSGADDYLAKPFALEELLARVRALLRRPAEQQNTVLRSDDLALDTANRRVTRGNKDIPLTSKEYGLLEYLLRNKNRPVSKDTIMQHVWDYDANILPNTVEVYIKYLRAKIDKPFGRALIKTVRGFGYKLEDGEKK